VLGTIALSGSGLAGGLSPAAALGGIVLAARVAVVTGGARQPYLRRDGRWIPRQLLRMDENRQWVSYYARVHA